MNTLMLMRGVFSPLVNGFYVSLMVMVHINRPIIRLTNWISVYFTPLWGTAEERLRHPTVFAYKPSYGERVPKRSSVRFGIVVKRKNVDWNSTQITEIYEKLGTPPTRFRHDGGPRQAECGGVGLVLEYLNYLVTQKTKLIECRVSDHVGTFAIFAICKVSSHSPLSLPPLRSNRGRRNGFCLNPTKLSLNPASTASRRG